MAISADKGYATGDNYFPPDNPVETIVGLEPLRTHGERVGTEDVSSSPHSERTVMDALREEINAAAAIVVASADRCAGRDCLLRVGEPCVRWSEASSAPDKPEG